MFKAGFAQEIITPPIGVGLAGYANKRPNRGNYDELYVKVVAMERDGKKFGFNIGYGFGDTSAASENMLFYDGKAHKLEDVTFNIPGDGTDNVRYTEPWTFTSSDGRLELDFVPVVDREAPIDLKVFCMIPHQVFGWFSGKCILDDGTVITLDKVMGFAEKVHNKW